MLLSISYTPIILFIRYTLKAENPVGYLGYLKGYLSTISDFGITILSKSTSIEQANSFSLVHLWFISVLFIFFCITGAVYKFITNKEKSSTQVIKTYFPALIIAGVTIALTMSAINLSIFDWEWIKAGPFLMFAPTRIPVYLGMFILGAYGFKNNWFINEIPGKSWKWFIVSIIISVLLLACSKLMWDNRDNTIEMTMIHGFFRSFVAISWFCIFLNLSKKYMNKTNKFLNFINTHSYETYLLHLPIAMMK